jgi:hypothetical protein
MHMRMHMCMQMHMCMLDWWKFEIWGSPVPATALHHHRLYQRLMATQKAHAKSSCYHMCAALRPLFLGVHRAACLPKFRIRCLATERQNGRPRPPAAAHGR